jgi:phosphotransferase system  glucose/maltose/N-acetylglucosamine-specific IIC component
MDGEIRSLTEGDAITSERTIPISVTNPKRDNSLLLVVVAASILVIVFFVGRYLINKNGKGRKGARGDR